MHHEVKSKHKAIVKAKARRAKAKNRVIAKPAVAALATVPVAAVTAAVTATVVEPVAQTVYVPSKPVPVGNPYLAYQQQSAPLPNPWNNVSQFGSNLKSLLPSIPEGQSILPSIKKVYPTGEKPLVVLTFKCPTELIGITPLPTKLLHDGVNGVFDLVNATNILSFNMQQVCQ